MGMYLGILLFVPFAGYMLTQPTWVQNGIYVLGPVFVAYIIYEAFRSSAEERNRLFVLLVLIFFSITFWACFEQAGSSMTLFAKDHVDRNVFGWEVPTSWFQAVNPFFIVVLAIPFSLMWLKLGKAKLDPSPSLKFSLGLIQMAGGFIAMVIGAREAA